MPYLRVYLPEISIAQKRHIARKLIDTTLRAIRRRRYWDRDQITIQFLPQPRPRGNCRVELHCHNLTSVNQHGFAEEVAPVLVQSLHLNVKNRLAWLMGVEAKKMPPDVDVEFFELPFEVSPSESTVGDAFVADWNRVA